jgi:hypothetical protein
MKTSQGSSMAQSLPNWSYHRNQLPKASWIASSFLDTVTNNLTRINLSKRIYPCL